MSIKAISWAIEVDGIKPGSKLVLMLLADAHNGQTGECFPHQERIAERAGMGISTVKDHLRLLEEAGLIRRDTERLGRGKGSRTSYVLSLRLDRRNLDVQNLDVQVSANRPPKNTHLDSQISDFSSKEEPEGTGKEPEGAREKQIFDHYNQIAERVGWVKHSKLTDAYRKAIRARVNDHSVGEVITFLNALSKQDWTFRGFAGNDKFRVSLMYAMRPRTFAEHFDKLTQPAGNGTAPVGDTAKRDKLDWLFERFAKTGEWMGERYGFQFRPDDPRSDYPAEVYARYNLTKPQVAA